MGVFWSQLGEKKYHHVHIFGPESNLYVFSMLRTACALKAKADIYIFSLKSWKLDLGMKFTPTWIQRGKKGDTLIDDIQQGAAINIPGGRPANISSRQQSESGNL